MLAGTDTDAVCGVSLDSRAITRGELFIAIRGERFNGHNFIEQALQRQARAVLLCEDSGRGWNACGVSVIKVKDSVEALGRLAHYHRRRFRLPVIAVTGSSGKTTTKEMLRAVLSVRYNVLYNWGTQNNHIGVPLTLLRLNKEHSAAVLEIGANHFGEVRCLSRIIAPTAGIITNIGPAHLEFFHSLRGVFKVKRELLENIAPRGRLIVNGDDRFLSRLRPLLLKISTFGMNHPADFSGRIAAEQENETVFLLNNRQRITVKALGRHNVYNALAACACARLLGMPLREIKEGLALFSAPPMRMQLQQINNVSVINDCYNANPASFACALDFLKQRSTGGRKIIVCGEMLELGEKAEDLHLQLGKKMVKAGADLLIAVGGLGRIVNRGACLAGMPQEAVYHCGDAVQAGELLKGMMQPADLVLIKGSRGAKMEKVIECFTTCSIH